MEESKDHLDIDLEFLDKKEPIRVPPKPKSPQTSMPTGNEYKWKIKDKIAFGFVLSFVILVGWASYSDNGSSPASTSNNSYTPPVTNEDTDSDGHQYSCASYDANKADSLKPTLTNADFEWAAQDLKKRSESLDVLEKNINNTYVDENNQDSINSYNHLMNDYNFKLETFKKDFKTYEQKSNQFDMQINAYNNYLQSNCTLKY